MAKKKSLELDSDGNKLPYEYRETDNPKTAMRYIFFGFVIGVLILGAIVKFKDYTFALYKPEKQPQLIEVQYAQDGDINAIALINVDDVHSLCNCKDCYGCKLNYQINNKRLETIGQSAVD